jgi:DNA-binding MarR family transcriptional regulator
MDSDAETAHTEQTVYQTPPTRPRAKIHYLGTTGYLLNREVTGEFRDELVQAVGEGGESVAIIDLGGAVFSPGSLQELLLPLARRLRSGEAGPVALIVIAADPGVADFVRMLATTHGLPMYVSDRPGRVVEAEPAGRLTLTEKQTIDILAALGGQTTVSTFAHELNMQITAAGNRLTNLTERGYLLREPRSRREGDSFIDPRRVAHREVRRHQPLLGNDEAPASES